MKSRKKILQNLALKETKTSYKNKYCSQYIKSVFPEITIEDEYYHNDNYCYECENLNIIMKMREKQYAQIVVKHLTYKLKLILNQLTQKHIKDMNIFANC